MSKKAKPNPNQGGLPPSSSTLSAIEQETQNNENETLVHLGLQNAASRPELLPLPLSDPPQQSDFELDNTITLLTEKDELLDVIFDSLHEFNALRYQNCITPTSPCDTCWHQRLHAELSLGLQCCEYWLTEKEQDLGSFLFDNIQFYHAITPTFIKDFHTATDLCNTHKITRRNIDPALFDYHQRCVLAQITSQWLTYLTSLVYAKSGPEVSIGLEFLMSQWFKIAVSQDIEGKVQHSEFEKFVPYGLLPEYALLASQIATHNPEIIGSTHNIYVNNKNIDKNGEKNEKDEKSEKNEKDEKNEKNEKSEKNEKNLIQNDETFDPRKYRSVPHGRSISLSIVESIKEIGEQLHHYIGDYEAVKHRPASLVVLAWKAMPEIAKKPIEFRSFPKNLFYKVQYSLRKHLERDICQHECIRRELLLALTIEDTIQSYLVNDVPKIRLSLLWQLLSLRDSFCTNKTKCPSPLPDDPFVKSEHKYLTALMQTIGINERIAIYRQAQHVVYCIVYNTVPQTEMSQWFLQGIKGRKATHDCIITLAAKTAGPYPPPITQAVHDQVADGPQLFFPQTPEFDPTLAFGPGLLPNINTPSTIGGKIPSKNPTDDVNRKKDRQKAKEKTKDVVSSSGREIRVTSRDDSSSTVTTRDTRDRDYGRNEGSSGSGGGTNTKNNTSVNNQNSSATNQNKNNNNNNAGDKTTYSSTRPQRTITNTANDIYAIIGYPSSSGGGGSGGTSGNNNNNNNNNNNPNNINNNDTYTALNTNPNTAKRKLPPPYVNTLPSTSLMLKQSNSLSSQQQSQQNVSIPLALLNTRNHIISPNQLDLGTAGAISTYFRGLTAVAGKYSMINPLDTIDQHLIYPLEQDFSISLDDGDDGDGDGGCGGDGDGGCGGDGDGGERGMEVDEEKEKFDLQMDGKDGDDDNDVDDDHRYKGTSNDDDDGAMFDDSDDDNNNKVQISKNMSKNDKNGNKNDQNMNKNGKKLVKKLNPKNQNDKNIVSKYPKITPKTTRTIINQLDQQYNHINTMNDVMVHLLQSHEQMNVEKEKLKDIVLLLSEQVITLNDEVKQLRHANELLLLLGNNDGKDDKCGSDKKVNKK